MKDLKFFLTIGAALVLIYLVIMVVFYGILFLNAMFE